MKGKEMEGKAGMALMMSRWLGSEPFRAKDAALEDRLAEIVLGN